METVYELRAAIAVCDSEDRTRSSAMQQILMAEPEDRVVMTVPKVFREADKPFLSM
jgi:hypothetical protein